MTAGAGTQIACPDKHNRCMENHVAVRLRLKRMGRTHRSFFRLGAMDSRTRRDGRVIEELGWYDPNAKDPDKQVSLDKERIEYWLSVGAQPSETVTNLLKNNGIGPGAMTAEQIEAAQAKAKSDYEANQRAKAEQLAKADAAAQKAAAAADQQAAQAAAAPAEAPAEESAEAPAEQPQADAPAEGSQEAPAEQPAAEAPAEGSDEAPAEQPQGDESGEKEA